MTKEHRAFRKAMQIGTTWVRTNHVNPRAAEPVHLVVVKRTKDECVFNNSGYLKWPDLCGFAVEKKNDSQWSISDSSGRLILTYSKP